MNNVTDYFKQVYTPQKALVIYRSVLDRESCFVEAFDCDTTGKMVNAHPLSMRESRHLCETLRTGTETDSSFLHHTGILPDNVLSVQTGKNGTASWFTKPCLRNLSFIPELGLLDGLYALPGLLWIADQNSLSLFALRVDQRPKADTVLYNAPFFNVYETGKVCMGNVSVEIHDRMGLEDFITRWDACFFGSRFSHLITQQSPVKGNIIQLYKSLYQSKKKFPVTELLKSNSTIQKILYENR